MLGVGSCLLAGATLAAPVGAGAATPASGSAANKSLVVTGAFLPLPASPSVASAYLQIHNLTSRADALVSMSTAVAQSAMAMSEGTSSMQMLGPVTIPAHGVVSFTPGHDHVMLQGLNRKLKVGQVVDIRLQFRHSGTLDLEIPVVPLNRILPGGGGSKSASAAGTSNGGGSTTKSPPTSMGKMSGMSGMSGTAGT